MENQTYSRKISANYILQLSHKRKSWQSLISVATNKHNQQEESDLNKQLQQQIVCSENKSSNKKEKKIEKVKRRTSDQSRIKEEQFEQQVEKMLLDELDTTTLINTVYQHEADTTMLKFNGKKSSYSNRLWSNKSLRSTWFTCSLLATIFIAILSQPADSWRIFEPGTEARHALGSIINNNNNNLFTSFPINPAPNQNQNLQLLLTPQTQPQQKAAQPQPAVALSATELASNQNTRQQTSKEPDLTSLSSRSSDSTPNNKNQQQESSKQDTSSHAGSSIPALVGKILDATSESLVNNKNNSFGFPSALSLSEKLTNTSSQLLKPRKSTDKDQSSSSKHINSVEQQIINQHANMLASHQRLMPTKQRDQKITSLLSSSSSSSFDSRNSPLNSILDTFKSSISSRSSIVKAISDNKLARTLSEVGKSISGNKYVAGAAAASAIAALGLAVSKFLSPYAFSGTPYSKIGAGMIGDPMLSSESNMRPSYLAATTDAQSQFYQNPADSMFPAASQPSGTIRSPHQSLYPMPGGQADYNNPSGLSNDVGGQYQTAIYQAANAFQPSAFSPQQSAAASSSGYLDSSFNSLAGNSNNNRVFFTYTKGTKPAASSLSPSPSSSSPSPQIQPGDTGTGHYSGFYTTGADTTLSNYNNNNNQYEFPYLSTGVQSEHLNNNKNNEQQHSSGRSLPFGQIQNGNEYQSNGNENDILSSQQQTTSTPFELNSSSSFDNPISVYAQQASQEKLATRDKQHYSSALPSAGQNMFISAAGNGMAPSSQSTGFTSRRSGPVSIKMNDSIRERLNNLQKINNKTPQYWMTRQPTTVVELSDSDFKTLTSIGNNYKYPYSSTPSPNSGGSFVPIIAASGTTNNVEQPVTAIPIKSSRVESNEGDQQQQQQQAYSSTIGNNHASSSNKPKRQQQEVSYTIIRPKTGSAPGKLEAIMPEAALNPSQSATSDGGLQRSFTSKAAGASWSTVTSKQIASNNNNGNQQISEQGVDNNQAAVGSNSEGGSQQQQQQQPAEQTLLHRVSRTPNQSSVKQQTSGNINSSENSKLLASGGTDYELTAASENLGNKLLPPSSSNGLKSNNIGLPYFEGSSSLDFSGDKLARNQGATNRQQQQQHVAHDDHRPALADATANVEDNTTTNDDELKTTTNLIQLSADGNSEGDQINNSQAKDRNQNNNANNNVRLIEANTSNVSERQVEISADKLADTGLVIMLPTTRNGHTSDTTERRATSMKSTGDLTTTTSELKQRHNNKLHSTESNLNDNEQQQQRGKLDNDDKRDSAATQLSSSSSLTSSPSSSSSSDSSNEEMSPDTPFGGFFGNAGYSLGGQR